MEEEDSKEKHLELTDIDSSCIKREKTCENLLNPIIEQSTLMNFDDDFQDENRERLVFGFPEYLENFFRSFDDNIIKVVQFFNQKKPGYHNKVIGVSSKYLAIMITVFTLIENGQFICLFLQLVSQDYLAKQFLFVGFACAFTTQIPKRFLFRKRPFMANRAVDIVKYKTSSFPSRAVICATVYAFALVYSYNYYHKYINDHRSEEACISIGYTVLASVIATLMASWGRIYLGAHYPSDCLFGAIFGSVILACVYGVNEIPNLTGCNSCFDNKCYSVEKHFIITADDFQLVNLTKVATSTVFIFLVFLVLSSPPLKFWEKSAPIFGSYFAVYIAGIFMACTTDTQLYSFSYVKFENLSWGTLLGAALIAWSNILLSMSVTGCIRKLKIKKRWLIILFNIMLFWIFFIVFIVIIVVFRLHALPKS